jgi:hypothetical protein
MESERMTTPKKSEIIELAKQLYFNDMAKSGINNFNDPEPNELAEGGYIQSAKSMLMRDQYKAQVESKDFYDLENDFQFDVREAMQTTTFISGSRGIGKSDIAMYIVDQLTNEGVICITFDSSLDWLKRSSIQKYTTVKPYAELPIPNENMIFDLTLLTPSEQQVIVEQFCRKLFENQINDMANKYYLVFEESQLYFPLNSIRAKRYQYTTRVLTVGRNVGISLCAISQFPSSIDCELRKNAQQIYIGCTSELNTIAYWKGILGSQADSLKNLENGSFIYYNRGKISRISIEPYQSEIVKAEVKATLSQPIQPLPKQADSVKATVSFVSFLIWLFAMIIAWSGLK